MRKRAMGCEFTMRKSDRVRVHYERQGAGVRVDHEKKRAGEELTLRKRAMG